MQRAVELFLRAVPKMMDVILIYILFMTIYSLLGVQLFAGKFGQCELHNLALGGGAADLAPSSAQSRRLLGAAAAPSSALSAAGLSAAAASEAPMMTWGHRHAPPSNRSACEASGGSWENPAWGNFDNFPSSALVLFEMATLEGWTTVVYAGIDAVAPDVAPQRDYAPVQVRAVHAHAHPHPHAHAHAHDTCNMHMPPVQVRAVHAGMPRTRPLGVNREGG